MKDRRGQINRRDFIKSGSLLAVGGLLSPRSTSVSILRQNSGRESSRVVVVTDETCTSGTTIHTDVVSDMVDTGIAAYTDIDDVGAAWKSLFPRISENSVIGIKISLLNYAVPTNPETTQAVIDGLLRIQFPSGTNLNPNNIIIWDRTNDDLENAGYSINTGTTGVRCFGTDEPGVGYDYDNALNVNGRTSYPSRIYTEHIDYLINLGVIKDHSISGATLTLKNHYGSIHNPSYLHGNSGDYCDPYIPALNRQLRDELGDKQKFCMVDAIFGMYHSGPTGPPNFVYNGIIMGEDTVSVDRVGLDILVEKGMNHAWQATHIQTASIPPYDLGNYDHSLIERLDLNNAVGAMGPTAGGPTRTRLIDNYPNPFNSNTTIRFMLMQGSKVRLAVSDLQGREIALLVDEWRSAGTHTVAFRGSGLPSGAYIARLTVGDMIRIRRISLAR